MFCLTGALALATTSCKDEKVTTMQTITVNGQICEVKSAFYVEEKADEQWETSYDLILFREYFSTLPFTMSDYGVDIEVSESLIGKTIDLTEPVTQTGPLHPHNLLKAHPSPRPALNLPPLSKGGGLTASHKLSLCCIFTCDTSAFFIHQTFCRQDGGIASPPSLAPHQPFQKPYYPLRIANTLALLAPPVAPNTALAQDDN